MPTVNMIVTAAALQGGKDAFAVIDPDSGGVNTFSVQLSASGNAPATHYGCRTPLDDAALTALSGTNNALKTYVDGLAAQRGRLTASLGSIQAFKQGLTIDQSANFWGFVTAQGLKAVGE